jgi:uncharacterized protein YqeY
MKTFENINQIKTERLFQRNNPVIYSLLGVLLGELDRLPTRENPTESQIYTVVKKLYESAEYMAERDLSEESKIEYAYLKDYIKPQLSEDEIRDFISTNNFTNIGMVMKYFKDTFPGMYDGKLVSKIAKEIIG